MPFERSNSYTDPNALTAEWYKDTSRSEIRIMFNSYGQLKYPDYVLVKVNFSKPLTILDAGCGTGILLDRIGVKNTGLSVGFDISLGMLKGAKDLTNEQLETFQADVHYIPVASEAFDIIFCNFVLYHAQNIIKALEEISRILKRNGQVILVTKSKYSKKEIDDSVKAFLKENGVNTSVVKGEERFCLENAASFLEQVFQCIEYEDFTNILKVESAEKYVEYMLSTIYYRELFDKLNIEDFYQKMIDFVSKRDLTVIDKTRLFICSKS